MHVEGSCQTSQFFIDPFAATMTKISKEIRMILESNSFIEFSKVSVTGTKLSESASGSHFTNRDVVEFIAMCFVRIPKLIPIPEKEMNEIELSINSSFTRSNSSLYKFFDDQSFGSCELSITEPQVIQVNSTLPSEKGS